LIMAGTRSRCPTRDHLVSLLTTEAKASSGSSPASCSDSSNNTTTPTGPATRPLDAT
jgi:hypothetical protein